jgi:hypothetical protein
LDMSHIRLIPIIALVLSNALSGWGIPYVGMAQGADSVYAAEGIGIRGVVVGYSTMDSVVANYGKEFRLVEHGNDSSEIEYADLGLSFWYRHDDAEKKIYCITLKPPCECFTAHGILVGKSSIQDVFNAYGESPISSNTARDSWAVKYPGVEFYVGYDPKDDTSGAPRSLLKRKVTAIDIIAEEARVQLTPRN